MGAIALRVDAEDVLGQPVKGVTVEVSTALPVWVDLHVPDTPGILHTITVRAGDFFPEKANVSLQAETSNNPVCSVSFDSDKSEASVTFVLGRIRDAPLIRDPGSPTAQVTGVLTEADGKTLMGLVVDDASQKLHHFFDPPAPLLPTLLKNEIDFHKQGEVRWLEYKAGGRDPFLVALWVPKAVKTPRPSGAPLDFVYFYLPSTDKPHYKDKSGGQTLYPYGRREDSDNQGKVIQPFVDVAHKYMFTYRLHLVSQLIAPTPSGTRLKRAFLVIPINKYGKQGDTEDLRMDKAPGARRLLREVARWLHKRYFDFPQYRRKHQYGQRKFGDTKPIHRVAVSAFSFGGNFVRNLLNTLPSDSSHELTRVWKELWALDCGIFATNQGDGLELVMKWFGERETRRLRLYYSEHSAGTTWRPDHSKHLKNLPGFGTGPDARSGPGDPGEASIRRDPRRPDRWTTAFFSLGFVQNQPEIIAEFNAHALRFPDDLVAATCQAHAASLSGLKSVDAL